MFAIKNGQDRPPNGNVANSTSNGVSTTNSEQEISACTKCGRDVPVANLMLHEARCNGARQAWEQSMPSSQSEHQSESEPAQNHSTNEQVVVLGQQTESHVSGPTPITASAPPSAPPAVEESAYSNASAPPATFVGNIRPPRTTQSASTSAAAAPSRSSASASATADSGNNIQLSEGQWQCPRCTLINELHHDRCDVCLAPNPTNRPAAVNTSERLIQEVNNGWVNVTYNPQFQMAGRGNIRRVRTSNSNGNTRFSARVQNPLVHGSGNVGTAARVFNGLVNGAIVGSVFAGMGGMIVGGIAGAAGGVMVDRARNREEQQEANETREVANMLANDGGGIQAGSVRVHRSNGHITALASDNHGRNRVIRVRYRDGRRSEIEQQSTNDEQVQQHIRARGDLERSLLEILVQMSYSRDFGPGPGPNVILQPEESFEELIQRFGLGNDNRGASQEVIDSYPVEVVRRVAVNDDDDDDDSMDIDIESESDDESDHKTSSSQHAGEGKTPESDAEDESHHSMETDETSDLGTCNICLEDFKEGELKKTLACPNHPHCFHKDCIDKWLKLVASCPICKNDVGMCKQSK